MKHLNLECRGWISFSHSLSLCFLPVHSSISFFPYIIIFPSITLSLLPCIVPHHSLSLPFLNSIFFTHSLSFYNSIYFNDSLFLSFSLPPYISPSLSLYFSFRTWKTKLFLVRPLGMFILNKVSKKLAPKFKGQWSRFVLFSTDCLLFWEKQTFSKPNRSPNVLSLQHSNQRN